MTDPAAAGDAELHDEEPHTADGPLLSYVVGRLDRAIRTRLGAILAPYGLTVAQFTTLSVLARRPGLSNAQLARRALILPQSMIQVISALENRGLVSRTRAHGRALQTQLTPAGQTLVGRTERAIRQMEADMLAEDEDARDAARTMRVMQRWSTALARRAEGGQSERSACDETRGGP